MVLRELLLKLGLEVDEAAFAKGELVASVIKATFTALVESVTENVKGAIEYGNAIEHTSRKIGIATDALQELQYAAKLSDVSAETMSMSIGHLAMNMVAAKDGSDDAAKALKGINFKDANGKLKATDEVLGAVADRFAKMPNGAEKTAQAIALFGRGGKELIPLLDQGAAGIGKLREEARDLGLVLDEKAVAASEDLNDNFERLGMISKGLWRSAIGPLLPAVNKLVKRFIAWKKANALVIQQRLEKYMGLVAKAIDVVGEAFKLLVDNADLVKIVLVGVAAAFGIMEAASIAAAASSAAAWLVAAAPFVLIGGLIAGILLVMNSIRRWKAGKQSAFGDFADQIASWLKPNKTDPWWLASIKDAVRLMAEMLGLADRLGLTTDKASGKAPLAQRALKAVAGEKVGGNLVRSVQSAPSPGIAQAGSYNAENNYGLDEDKLKDPNSWESKYARTRAAGYGNFRSSMAAYGWFGQGSHVPEARDAGGSGGANVTVNAPLNMSVTQNPGESGTDFSDRVSSQIKEHLQSTLQDAAAAVSR